MCEINRRESFVNAGNIYLLKYYIIIIHKMKLFYYFPSKPAFKLSIDF